MVSAQTGLLSTVGLIPHGFCLAWDPLLLWSTVGADVLIGLAYFSIPISILLFMRRHRVLRFNWVFGLFGLFIFACGTTHFIHVLNIWWPYYQLDAFALVITATISVITAVAIWPLVPMAAEFLNSRAAAERELLESNRRLAASEARIKDMADALPALIGYVDRSETYRFVNKRYGEHFQKAGDYFLGKTMREVLGPVAHDEVQGKIAGALAGKPQSFERKTTPGGKDMHVLVKYVPDVLHGLAGQPPEQSVAGFYVMVMDISERKAMERALVDSQDFLQRTGKLAGIGGWQVDLLSNVITWSPQTRSLHEADEDYVPEMTSAIEFYAPEVRPIVRAAVEDAIASGKPWDLELPMITAKGRPIWVRTQGDVSFDEAGKPIRLAGAFQDITERHNARRALQDSEARFRQMIDHSAIGCVLVSLDWRMLHVNAALCDMLGYPAEQLKSMALMSLTHPDDVADSYAFREDILTTARDSFRIEKRYLRADGSTLEAQTDTTLIRDSTGTPLYLVAQIQDIGERKRLAREEKVLTQRLSLAVRAAGIGVWDLDLHDNVSFWDERMHHIYGVPVGQPVDVDGWRSMVVEDDLPLIDNAIAAAMTSTRVQSLSYRIRHADHGIRHIDANLVANRDDDEGEPTLLIGVNMDVTDRVLAEHSVRDGRSMLRDLIDNLPVWVAMVDRDTNIVIGNRRYAESLHQAVKDIEGQHFGTGLNGQRAQRCLPLLARAQSGHLVEFEDVLFDTGKPVTVQGSYVPISEGPQAGNILIVLSDVTRLKQAEMELRKSNRELVERIIEVSKLQDQLREQAVLDGLTGLYNRRYFDEFLNLELVRARRDDYEVCLLMTDLDHFKHLNDRYGHQAGDAMLKAWADILRRHCRASDVACRYGGEEFIVVLPQISLSAAISRAETMRLALEKFALDFSASDGASGGGGGSGSKRIGTTVSIGVSSSRVKGETPETLIRAADNALYEAKASGRNKTVSDSNVLGTSSDWPTRYRQRGRPEGV